MEHSPRFERTQGDDRPVAVGQPTKHLATDLHYGAVIRCSRSRSRSRGRGRVADISVESSAPSLENLVGGGGSTRNERRRIARCNRHAIASGGLVPILAAIWVTHPTIAPARTFDVELWTLNALFPYSQFRPSI
ncbi:hypothetical protein V9T40_007423 [Parthenolecanium corni]|uniref:Uncharacterized protein n=1 Tax=Parthenolecanium corni TaxID=536013 RepID=A0AAN9TV04_9HEMI